MVHQLKMLSYNIHKGFTLGNVKYVLEELRHSIREVGADVVFLQEVAGNREVNRRKVNWANHSQFEFLADQVWPHVSYGKNAVSSKGDHGNAILSRFPFVFSENIDVSTNRFEGRGILHGVVEVENVAIHLICIHLALLESWRASQIQKLGDRIRSHVPDGVPLIIAGDFNDWRERATQHLVDELGLREAFLESRGSHARTFPIWMPFFKLDRVYFRGLNILNTRCLRQKPWVGLSDHAALCVDFEF
jgi:endonuclease/exonuclease/phosphatase family metal-dependent hydrolase